MMELSVLLGLFMFFVPSAFRKAGIHGVIKYAPQGFFLLVASKLLFWFTAWLLFILYVPSLQWGALGVVSSGCVIGLLRDKKYLTMLFKQKKTESM